MVTGAAGDLRINFMTLRETYLLRSSQVDIGFLMEDTVCKHANVDHCDYVLKVTAAQCSSGRGSFSLKKYTESK